LIKKISVGGRAVLFGRILINTVKGMSKISISDHFTNITAMIVADQNHQWMLKLLGKNMMGNRVFA
jgi:hypothetical protein